MSFDIIALARLFETVRNVVLILALSAAASLGVAEASAGTRVVAWGAGTNVSATDYNVLGQSIVPPGMTNAVFVAAGWRQGLALNRDGSLTGWGDDSIGQLDFPTTVSVTTSNYTTTNHGVVTTNSVSVTNNVGYSNYVAISCGREHSLALDSDGLVTVAGNDDSFGALDVPNDLSNVVAIAAGFYHSLALKSDGTVVAWGPSTNAADIGQQPDYGQTLIPPDVSNVVAIAAGGFHSLVLQSDGTLRAWGLAASGQSHIPPGLSNVVAISAGSSHNLVLKSDGTVAAWGDNTYGQTNIPPGLSNVVAISAGGWHNLALKKDGAVVAWGAGTSNVPSVTYRQNIVPIGLTNVTQIAGGELNSLALVGNGPPPAKASLSAALSESNQFSVVFSTGDGHVYRLEYTESLVNPIWHALPLQAGRYPTTQLIDQNGFSTQRFYRVRQW